VPGQTPQETKVSRLLTIPNSLGRHNIPDSSNGQPKNTVEETKKPEFSHEKYSSHIAFAFLAHSW